MLTKTGRASGAFGPHFAARRSGKSLSSRSTDRSLRETGTNGRPPSHGGTVTRDSQILYVFAVDSDWVTEVTRALINTTYPVLDLTPMAVATADYQTTYVTPFILAVRNVFATMLSADCQAGEVIPYHLGKHVRDITSIVGLSGSVVGAISFSTSNATAFRILERMTGMETTVVDEFVRDVIGEMANMIGGHGKRELEHLQLKLGLPQVIVGSQYDIFAPRWAQHFWSPITTDLGPCTIDIGFDVQRRG